MVSLDRIHVIGSWYMGLHGGYKPRPHAFINYFKDYDFKPKRLFFLGNRLVDMKLASSLKKRLKCKVFKCLLVRDDDYSIANKYADKVVKNLWQVKKEIKEFKPDLIMSDFDNTLVDVGYDFVERAVEKTRFWERYQNLPLNVLYAIGSQFSIPFLRRKPYRAKYDDTESFIRSLKQPLIIHTMSPETAVRLTLKKIIG